MMPMTTADDAAQHLAAAAHRGQNTQERVQKVNWDTERRDERADGRQTLCDAVNLDRSPVRCIPPALSPRRSSPPAYGIVTDERST